MHRDPVRHPNPYTFDVSDDISTTTIHSQALTQSCQQPERYLNDTVTSAESAHLANPMERDHWAFGVGYVSPRASSASVPPPYTR